MRPIGGGLTALLALAAGAAVAPSPRGPFYPLLSRGGGKTHNPWPMPNCSNTQTRTDHQHEGERARRRRRRERIAQ